MSTNSNGEEKGAGGAGANAAALGAQLPKLRDGAHYPQWRDDAHVSLERFGAKGVHEREITPKAWKHYAALVQSWSEAAVQTTLARYALPEEKRAGGASAAGAGGAESSTTATAPGAGTVSEEETAHRKELQDLVANSTRVYGVLYAALPEDVRKQSDSIARGHAYGLWHWLETKYQSTEEDSVWLLLEQWMAMRQEEGEPFDAFRARVDKLDALLAHAKEQLSRRMYSLMLLNRLQPQYKAAVLALKAAGSVKNAAAADWNAIAAFLNAHEREEARASGGDASSGGGAWANAAHLRGKAGTQSSPSETREREWEPTPLEEIKCFTCGKFGHKQYKCPSRKGARAQQRSDKHVQFESKHNGASSSAQQREGQHASAAVQREGRNNRYAPLSDDEEGHERIACAMVVPSSSPVERAMAAPVKKMTIAEKEAQAAAKAKETAKRAPKVPIAKPEARGAAAKQETNGTSLKPLKYAQLDAKLSSDAWGVDSMASVPVSGNRNNFVSLRKVPEVQIKTADGSIITANQAGTVLLSINTDKGRTVRIKIDGVLYHERFASNLLSCEKLTKELDWEYHSTKEDGTYMITPGGNRVTLSTAGRIAVLLGAGPERVYSSLLPGSSVRDDVPNPLVLLHERLCHMGFDSMLELLRSTRVDGLGTFYKRDIEDARKHVQECRACLLGKQSRNNLGHRGLVRGKQPAEVIHMDTYEVRCLDRDGFKQVQYGIAMTDTYSREGWHAFVHRKDAVSQAVIAQLKLIERHTGHQVKLIISDGGGEFINHTLERWLEDKGIRIRPSPPYTKQLNGVAERSVRTFKDAGRTLLARAHAPKRLWPYAVSHAVWVWNRVRRSDATGKTPYETACGRKPNLKGLAHVWGSNCFVHQRKELRAGAFAAKSEPGIYLGHSDETSAATVLIMRTGKCVVTKDVKVHDGRFEHLRALEAGEDEVAAVLDGSSELLFPSLSEDWEPESMQSQGECKQQDSELDDSLSSEQTEAADAKSDADGTDPDEWKVERIMARRVIRGAPQFRVRWEGYGADEDTWESEEMIADLEAYDVFLQQQPEAPTAAAQPRRSPRLHPDPLPESIGTADDDDDDADSSGRVQMVMGAMCSVQKQGERLSTADIAIVMNAIKGGIAAISDRTPKTLKEALAGKDAAQWREARQREYDSCVALKVWEEVPRASLPRGTNILPYKEVFRIKMDVQGSIAQFKARFTPKGFRQKDGVDYDEDKTFARTGMYKTERVALSLAAKFGNIIKQFDVPTAFLHADLEETVYMEMPAGFGQPGMVCLLRKSLYGLKQAPRNWDRLVHAFITEDMGWSACVSDPSLYHRRSRTGRLMMIYRFVDDMQGQHHEEDTAEFEEHSGKLCKRFGIKKLQDAAWMLGMRITRNLAAAGTITLDQEQYISKALERFGLAECKVANSPEVPGAATDSTPGLDKPTDRQRFMEMVGTLMYAAISTRPDIAHATYYLAANMVAPTSRHMLAAERVFRYLAGTKEVGLVFGSRNGDAAGDSRGHSTQVQVDVTAFADADWANDKGDRKSISGWVAKLNGDPVSWSSKKQRVVALSTCEAELYAESAAIQEVLWLRGLLAELGLHTKMGSVVHGDNQSTIAVSKKGVKGERTKHVDVKYHFVTETVESGKVKLQWVPSAEQQADIFTKALHAPVFLKLRAALMTR